MGGYSGLPNGYVPGGTASLADIITGMGQEKGNAATAQAQPALVQAQTVREQALAKQADIAAQLDQQKLKDAQIIRDSYGALSTPPPAAGGTAAPGSAPAAAPPETPEAMMQRVLQGAMQRGISATGMYDLQNHIYGLKKSAAGIAEQERATQQANHDEAGKLLLGVNDLPPEQRADAYAAAHPRLEQLAPGTLPAQYPGDPAFASIIGGHALSGALLGQKKTGAEIANLGSEAAKNTAQAGEATAATPGKAAESTRQQLITAAMQRAQQAPQNGQHPIDAILPASLDQTANSSYKSAYDTAMANGGPEAATHIATAAAGHAAQIAMASNPNVRAGKVADAVAVERATGPLKVQQAVNAEIEKAKQAPGAFSAVVDPALRTRAVGDFEKSSNEYADKLGAAQQLQDFVTAAQSGNKAAPGLIPIQEVRGLVNRVTRQELESVSKGAGSAWDRIQGKIGGFTEGQPIPPDMLKDIKTIGDTMAGAAKRTYGYKVQVTNATYGSKAQPIEFAAPKAGGASLPEIASQSDYDKLAKGAQYTHNGEVLTKK